MGNESSNGADEAPPRLTKKDNSDRKAAY